MNTGIVAARLNPSMDLCLEYLAHSPTRPSIIRLRPRPFPSRLLAYWLALVAESTGVLGGVGQIFRLGRVTLLLKITLDGLGFNFRSFKESRMIVSNK